MKFIDLRSDTVTKPGVGMRRAMADAEVGDDVYGEDPTVRELEARVAALLGKEAALFVPSGTMANQLAIRIQTRPGDHVLVGEGAHCERFETGAAAALSGVQMSAVGSGGTFDADEMTAAALPAQDYLPRTQLVCVENTHNMAGGRVFPQQALREIYQRAKSRGLCVHLDGARLWNASAATGLGLAELSGPADTVSVCFSKGLGAPVGSALAGTAERMSEARRVRKMFGGGMRQVGILASAALYALDYHLADIEQDHEHAHGLGAVLRELPGVEVLPVETNIVMLELKNMNAQAVAAAAKAQGVLLNALTATSLRLVTHRDVSGADALLAGRRLARVIENASLKGEERPPGEVSA